MSCVAAEDGTVLLTMDREVVTSMIGSIQDIMSGSHQLDEMEESLSEFSNLGKKYCLDMQVEDLSLVTVLGSGAFGKVMLGKDKRSEKTYAVKCQSKKMIIDQQLTKHVMTELHIMVLFNHPNICSLHTCFQDKRYLYFIIELLQGGEVRPYTILCVSQVVPTDLSAVARRFARCSYLRTRGSTTASRRPGRNSTAAASC